MDGEWWWAFMTSSLKLAHPLFKHSGQARCKAVEEVKCIEGEIANIQTSRENTFTTCRARNNEGNAKMQHALR